jgi:hypothetical protein
MVRLRGALVIVAFSLLTSAATAYAECAWVLWGRTDRVIGTGADTKIQVQWVPVGASTAKTECENALRQWVEGLVKNRPAKATEVPAPVCLPDTVDPRGPKGK